MTAAEATFPVRRVSFEEALRSLDRHFAGDLVASHLLASLSSVFPDGEDFFVRSVRHYRSEITDPQLAKDVNAFIGQEMVHGREHRVFNDRLGALGYPTKWFEGLTKKGLAAGEKRSTPEQNLAATAALEHFTATMGERLLRDDTLVRMIGDEHVKQLFLWHALEETEHKAVAFDVYRAVGGSERVRVKAMNAVTWQFLLTMVWQIGASLLRDRAAWNPIRLWRSLRYVAGSPLFSKQMWRTLRDYNRPGFHPNDHETADLLAAKRIELFGDDGRITPRLAA